MFRDMGLVEPGSTIYVPFATFDSNDPQASVACSGLAVTDIEVYKDGSMTQRGSDNGYTLLDTDGIDLDGIVGIHGISISLADNSTAGFWAAGSQYWVVIASITVDAATINFIPVLFRIGYRGAILNTTIATLSSQTSFTLTNGPAEDDALNGCIVLIHDVASAVQLGFAVISDYTGSTKTVTLAAGTTFTAAATDNISVFPPPADSAGITTLLARLTSTRAGYLDNLSAGAVATAAKLLSYFQSALRKDVTVDADIGGGYDDATDSQEALRDRGDAAWITATGFSTHSAADVWAVATRALTDKAGFALSAAGVQAIWDALTAALTTANSIGRLLVDNVNATISSRASQTSVDTIDDFVDGVEALLGDATVGLAALEALVDELEARLTAARAGYLDNLSVGAVALEASVNDLEGRITAAVGTALGAHAPAVLRLVVGSGSDSTHVKFDTVNGAAPSAVDDFYNGQIIKFTSGALAGQVCEITDYVGATTTATVSQLTGSPANAVTAVVL